jgi:hypothetical protein
MKGADDGRGASTMNRMRMRTVTALLAALAVGAPALAHAATPTPTPSPTATPTTQPSSATPTPTPTPAPRTKGVQRVYDDYHADGVISACRHSLKDLERTLKTIGPSFDSAYPDFRPAVQAAIARHEHGKCAKSSSASPSATPTPAAKTTPAPTATAVPTATSSPSKPQSGLLPGGVPHSAGGAKTPGARSSPVPSVTPAPGAVATPAPTAAATPGPPRLVVQREHVHRDLTVPGALLGAALLVAVLLGLSALAAARSPRLAGMHHAWREAAYRTRGTWRDFSEWLRLGR